MKIKELTNCAYYSSKTAWSSINNSFFLLCLFWSKQNLDHTSDIHGRTINMLGVEYSFLFNI